MTTRLTLAAASAMQVGDRLTDHVVPGLELRRRGRNRVWYLYYRQHGKQRRPKIGEYPVISIEEARRIAQEALRRVARGDDPSAERQALRASPTVAQLCQRYLDEHAAQHKAAKSREEDARNIRLHIKPRLGSEHVAAVRPADVIKLHRAIGRTRPVLANRLLSLLSKMFNFAERESVGWRERGTNPTHDDGIKRYPETAKDRYASTDEVGRIFDALDDLAVEWPRRVAAIYMMIYTGARVSECAGARVDQYDAAAGRITLTEHKTAKGRDGRRRARVIHIPPQLAARIAALGDDGTGRLFGDVSRYNIATVWRKARAAAGCDDMRMHDLRHSFASFARQTGQAKSLADIGDLLGHRSAQTTKRYAHLFDDTAVGISTATADLIDRAGRSSEND